jgi:plastocyanin
MQRLRWLIAGAAALALGCKSSSATASSGGPPPGATTVNIQDFSFSPDTVTIAAGKTVYWTNKGPSAHTTVSDAGLWNSGTLNAPSSSGGNGYSVTDRAAGGSFTVTFNTAGTFTYHCSIHPPSLYPHFVGTIIVH